MSNIKAGLNKIAVIAVAISTLSAAMIVETSSAQADWRHRRSGRNLGLGIVGGLAAGALIAGATRPSYADGYSSGGYYEAPRAYGGYGGGYEYDDAPVCRIERQKVYIDDYTYRIRKVRVCN
jgi:hypothetical protein